MTTTASRTFRFTIDLAGLPDSVIEAIMDDAVDQPDAEAIGASYGEIRFVDATVTVYAEPEESDPDA